MADAAHVLPLAVERLCAGYAEKTILRDISFTVQRAEIRAILGGSGTGKSTLLRHVVGLERPQSGHVALLGCNLHSADAESRDATLRRTGMLFQSGALLGGMTVQANVALPLRQATALPSDLIDEIARVKLALVGLEDAWAKYPAELSGGMKKRAALARAIALDPEILFCDEPSAGLDPVTAAALDHLIVSLRDQFGMAVVVVTHELASIHAIADTALMLDGGAVIADGSLTDVMANSAPVIRSFFGRQAKETTKARPSMLEVLGPKGTPWT
jgi:phospholipid/cholesterol/gamma-HCH transport system ATP-binding protein